MEPDTDVIAFRVDGKARAVRLILGVELDRVRHAEHRPDRFLWLPQQRHIPGFWWSCTNREHVPFESQLERRRVILADFDPTVARIVSQPFDLRTVNGVEQIPDFMLLHTDSTITIVNVKRPEEAAKPKVREKFAHVTRAVEQVGWTHEVWTGDSSPFARNVDLLSACMRPQLQLDLPIPAAELDGLTIAEATWMLEAVLEENARASVLGALWRHELVTDLSVDLHNGAVLRAAA